MDGFLTSELTESMQGYSEKHGLEGLFREMMLSLSIHQPVNVLNHLLEFLSKPKGSKVVD